MNRTFAVHGSRLMIHGYIRFMIHGEWLMVVGWRDEK